MRVIIVNKISIAARSYGEATVCEVGAGVARLDPCASQRPQAAAPRSLSE